MYQYNPYVDQTYAQSLAKNGNQIPGTGMQADGAYNSLRTGLAEMGVPNILGTPDSLANQKIGEVDAVKPPGSTPFFNNSSLVGNMGQGMNLIGSGVSLVGMLQGMKDARKNNDINRKNIGQQMAQSKTAFDRSVARQDGTSEAIRQRNERVAQMNQE